jgi:alpha/beta superfamily hydrolase
MNQDPMPEACTHCRERPCRALRDPVRDDPDILHTTAFLMRCPMVLSTPEDLRRALHRMDSRRIYRMIERFGLQVSIPPENNHHLHVNPDVALSVLLQAKHRLGGSYLGHLPHRQFPPFLRRTNPDPAAVARLIERMGWSPVGSATDATSVAATSPPPVASDTSTSARPASRDPVKTCILSVFTDGTCNDKDVDFPRGGATNVAKLYVLSKEGTEGDKDFGSFYIRGVGTSQGWDPALGGSIGMGFQDRVEKALRWIGESASKHPQAEIVVDLFGFSRGAAEAMQLTNSLHDPEVRATHHLSHRKLSIRFVGLFDPVAERGAPWVDLDTDADLTMHPTHGRTVVSLVAVGEVRDTFNLRSLRLPPSFHLLDSLGEGLAEGEQSRLYCSSDWPGIAASQPLPSPDWHEWRVPGVHSDVGGGYGPEEWIPDLPPEPPFPGESVEDYTCRMKDREMETGASPRGPTGNEPEPKVMVQTRIEKAYAERLRSGQPGTYNPGIRCRDNGLSRIYLWIMKTQAEKAGVVWKRQDELDEDHWKSIKPLPATHPLHSLHVYSTQPELLAGIVETELFWTTVVPSMHDSRWSDDVISRRRKRGVIFDGRVS